MKRYPLLLVAALLGAAVSAPAQFRIEGRFGRHHAGAIVVGEERAHARLVDGRVDTCPDGFVEQGPRRHVRRAGHRQRGRWETHYEQVLVPGYWHVEHLPATYGWIYSGCGHRHWGIVDRGGPRRTWVPPRWERRAQRVWVRC